MALLDGILQTARSAKAAPVPSGVCVIACDDLALTPVLESVFGSASPMVRAPAGLLSSEVIQRAAAKAIFLDGCSEIAIVTHDGCRLTALSATSVIEALQRASVPRTAVAGDLRELVGAASDPRQAASELAELLRRGAHVPESVLIHRVHVDAQGKVAIVDRGEDRRSARNAAPTAIGGYTSGPAAPLAEAVPEVRPAPARVPIAPPPVPARSPPPAAPAPSTKKAVEPASASDQLLAAVTTLRAFISNRLPEPERRRVRGELAAARAKGAPSSELVKLTLRPVLRLGEDRYRVLNELSTVNDELAEWPPKDCFEILEQLLR